MKLNIFDWIALVLVIVGSFNWGFIGWLNFNLVDTLVGGIPMASRIVYALVGVAGLYLIYTCVKLAQD